MSENSAKYQFISDTLARTASSLQLSRVVGFVDSLSWSLSTNEEHDILLELDPEKNMLCFSCEVGALSKEHVKEQCLIALKFNALWRDNQDVFIAIEDSSEPLNHQLIIFSKYCFSELSFTLLNTAIQCISSAYKHWSQLLSSFDRVEQSHAVIRSSASYHLKKSL